MFQYEYEKQKRPSSVKSCDSRATMTTDWSRVYPSARTVCASVDRARRPLPPRPTVCDTMPAKSTVPLKVWIIASASCFAVCAALVLATVVITKWGTTDVYARHELFAEPPEPIYSNLHPQERISETPETTTEVDINLSDEIENDIEFHRIEKLAIFKNIVAHRDKNKRLDSKKPEVSQNRKPVPNLVAKPQLHPLHDPIHHVERKIEKKDQAKYPGYILHASLTPYLTQNQESNANDIENPVPDFKPTLPDVFVNKKQIKLVDGYLSGLTKHADDYEEYYNDENLYDDYMQSNTMTNYLIEKVQELHDWITSDPDFEIAYNATRKRKPGNEFGQLLKALNESLIEGNVTIIMNKLKDIYFGENYTHANHSRKVILSNSTDLLSFGILTLDVMLLHNIQLMAWENQEAARSKMLKDPDVFAFNALFLEPSKVEAKQNEVYHHQDNSLKRQRQETVDEFDFGRNLLENVLEIGMSTARAAIHLGRAYKNTKTVLNQLSNRETLNTNIQNQISRNIDANTHALHHLQTSFNKNDSSSVANVNSSFTELDCVWLLYCKNLVVTAKLNSPYGTMARINGMALRMLTGELSPDKALDTMLYEVLTGWTELKCTDMFPRCSRVNAASVVMESILQPLRKSQSSNRSR